LAGKLAGPRGSRGLPLFKAYYETGRAPAAPTARPPPPPGAQTWPRPRTPAPARADDLETTENRFLSGFSLGARPRPRPPHAKESINEEVP